MHLSAWTWIWTSSYEPPGDKSQLSYGVQNQSGSQTEWKISFKDGSDDLLATLSVRGGKVGGFWIR